MADISALLDAEGLKIGEVQTSVRRPGVTYRASVYSTSAAATYTTTPTTTPAANSLLVAFVVSCYASSPLIPTGVTGHGVTYTNVPLPASALSTTHIISLWIANAGASPTNAAVVASQSGTTTGGAVIEGEVTDADLAGTLLDTLSHLATGTSATGTTGTVNNSLAAHVVNDDVLLSFWLHLANEATTPRSNWTETSGADGNFANPATGVEMQFRSDVYENTASATWTTSINWLGLTVGIDAASSTEPQESVKISDQLTARRYGDFNGAETARLDDIGQGETQMVGPGSWLHILDGPIIAALVAAGLSVGIADDSLKISDSVQAQLTVIERSVTENVKISDSATGQLDPLQQSATENLKVSDSASGRLDPIQQIVAESLKVSDSASGQLDPIQQIISENLKISDSVQALTDTLSASASENIKISDSASGQLDPLQQTTSENLKLSENASGQLDPLLQSATENLKLSDSASGQLDPLLVLLAENVKVSESAQAQLDPLITSVLTENLKLADVLTQPIISGDLTRNVTNESLKVSDSLQAERYGDRNVAAENVVADDVGQGTIQMIGVIHVVDQLTAAMQQAGLLTASATENVKISESLTATLDPLQASNTESLKISETILASLGDLVASVQESLKVSDSPQASENPERAVVTENVKISDSVAALIDPLQALNTEALKVDDAQDNWAQIYEPETIKISDSVQVSMGDLTVAITQEALKISDSVQASEDPEQASATENLKISDSVQAQVGAGANVTAENLKIADTPTALLDLIVSLQESLKISDSVQAVRYPLEVAQQEDVKISDAVNASSGNDLFVTTVQEVLKLADAASPARDIDALITESLKIADTVSTARDLEVNATEALRISDTASGKLDLIVSQQEALRITDTPTVNFPILSASLTESLRIQDVLTGGIDLLSVSVSENLKIADQSLIRLGNPAIIDVVGTYVTTINAVGTYVTTIDIVGVGAI